MRRQENKSERTIREHGELIRQKKAQLRRRIAGNPVLQRDFDFLLTKTGWHEEALLARLFWDCNMMSTDTKSFVARQKKQNWPISEPTLRGTISSILKVARHV